MLYCHVGPWLSEFNDVVHTDKFALGSVSLAVLYRHALFHAFFLGYVHSAKPFSTALFSVMGQEICEETNARTDCP